MEEKSAAANAPIKSSLSMYLGGLMIGLTLVSFPASSAVLKARIGLSDAQYGAIYLPQLFAAILGAVVGSFAAGKLTLKAQYSSALLCFLGAHVCLMSSVFVKPELGLPIIMCGTAFFGFGFGFGGGPLNAVVALLFPSRSTTAITALHMSAGAGLTLGPSLFAVLTQHDHWVFGPIGLAVLCSGLIVLTALADFPDAPRGAMKIETSERPSGSQFFWICALVAVVYSIAEGTFSNWAILFLSEERGLDAPSAALALTAFWAALTFGRLISSILAVRVTPIGFLSILPLTIALALWVLPSVNSPVNGIWMFALAGLGCSAFFPMLVAYAAGRYPNDVAWIGSTLTAAMMVGVGIGSYGIGALAGSFTVAELYRFALLCPVAILFLLMVSRRF
jgi:predicted MFS family arabinose efflux permease